MTVILDSIFDFIDILSIWARILVQVTIYRRLLIGRDGHLDQSEAYDISYIVHIHPCVYIALGK